MRRLYATIVLLAVLFPIGLSANTQQVTLSITVDAHSVDLYWTKSSGSNIAGYNIYRGTHSGGPYSRVNTILISGTTYKDTGVVGGTTYYYVATAKDTSGQESAYSNEARATTQSP